RGPRRAAAVRTVPSRRPPRHGAGSSPRDGGAGRPRSRRTPPSRRPRFARRGRPPGRRRLALPLQVLVRHSEDFLDGRDAEAALVPAVLAEGRHPGGYRALANLVPGGLPEGE